MVVRVVSAPHLFRQNQHRQSPLRHGIYYLYDVTHAYAIHWIALLALVGNVLRYRSEPQELCAAPVVARRRCDVRHIRHRYRRRFHAWSLWLPVLILLYMSLSGIGAFVLGALVPGGSPGAVTAACWATVLVVGATFDLSAAAPRYLNSDEDAQFHGISNQVAALLLRESKSPPMEPAPNVHTWADRGRRVAELSHELGEEIGVVAGGVGQTAFYGKRAGAEVYVFDLLALTQPVVARMDPGTGRRIGHKKRSLRSTRHSTNESISQVCTSTDTMRPFVYRCRTTISSSSTSSSCTDSSTKGSCPNATSPAAMFHRGSPHRSHVDINFVYFLSRRFRGNPRLEALIARLPRRRRLPSEWELWYRANASTIDSLHGQMRNRRRFSENFELALDNLALPTIPYLEGLPAFGWRSATLSPNSTPPSGRSYVAIALASDRDPLTASHYQEEIKRRDEEHVKSVIGTDEKRSVSTERAQESPFHRRCPRYKRERTQQHAVGGEREHRIHPRARVVEKRFIENEYRNHEHADH